VVAIIGILAAVGVVAYNGFTASTKKNAIKSNFKINGLADTLLQSNLDSTKLLLSQVL
jgi:Tfp pilus assembly protein PilE